MKLAQSVPNIAGETFQIATNKETTILEMVQLLLPILKEAGVKNIKIKHAQKLTGDVMKNFSDTSKAKKILGWECTWRLFKGIKQTVHWFKNI